MRFSRFLPALFLLSLAPGCVLDASTAPLVANPADLVEQTSDGGRSTAIRTSPSWPEEERFAETAAGLPLPYTLARVVGDEGAPLLALARRAADGWVLENLFSAGGGARPEGCEALPCAWPSSLVPASPLVEAAPLPTSLRDTVAYARTLLAFEGPLSIPGEPDDGAWIEELPASAWSDPTSAELTPYLERLRRYHPQGMCSMDTRPQVVAQMRARAAAQAGHTGWAVQGWMDTVGYWSSPRMAWSSYGQSHPEGHLALLEMVNVDPRRMLLGSLIMLPGPDARLHLADVRRIVPDLGSDFVEQIRSLAADSHIDALNRALLFASVGELPFAEDPLYANLPSESRMLIDLWSR